MQKCNAQLLNGQLYKILLGAKAGLTGTQPPRPSASEVAQNIKLVVRSAWLNSN